MSWRRVAGGLVLVANGCADTVTASFGAMPDGGAPLRDAGACRARLLPGREVARGLELFDAVRADGDNVAVFWGGFIGTDRAPLLMQRFGPLGEAVDAQPIRIADVDLGPQGTEVAGAAWDRDSGEPVVLVRPGARCGLYLGGLHRASTYRALDPVDSTTGGPLMNCTWPAFIGGGLQFFAITAVEDPRHVARVVVSPGGEIRSARSLPLSTTGPVHALSVVTLGDGSTVVAAVNRHDGSATADFLRLDARGEPAGGGSWRGLGALLDPPLAPTETGYLLGGDVGASTVGVMSFDHAGSAGAARRDIALPAGGVPLQVFSAQGHAFVVVRESAVAGRTYLQPLGAGGTEGAALPIESPSGSFLPLRLVATSGGGMLVLAAERGIAGRQVVLVPLRLCD